MVNVIRPSSERASFDVAERSFSMAIYYQRVILTLDAYPIVLPRVLRHGCLCFPCGNMDFGFLVTTSEMLSA